MILTRSVYSNVVLLQVYQNQELVAINDRHFLSSSRYQPKVNYDY